MTDDERKTLSELVKSVKFKPYSKEFWEKIRTQINKENEMYEEQCRALKIDPDSGKSTMSYEQRNKEFNL